MISYALALVLALGLRYYLIWFNRRLDRKQVVQATQTIVIKEKHNRIQSVEKQITMETDDMTDLKTVGFRYRV